MVFIQAVVINGIHECFQGSAIKDELKGEIFYEGMIFYMIAPKFFEKYKYNTLSKPFYTCVKCMGGLYGALTYWPLIIWLFGFKWCQIPICFADILCLIVVNFIVYKKL